MPCDATQCPLCGQPNACALAARTERSSCADCWCAGVAIDPQVLARVPAAAVGVACLCRACATGGEPAADSGRSVRSNAAMSESLPSGITHTKDPGGRAAIQLDGPGGKALVALCGAQVLSYRDRSGDVLWTASKSDYAPGKPVRGGVPVVFPWFGDHPTDKKLPAHGFARSLDWRLVEALPGPRIVLATNDDANTRALWPHSFAMQFAVDLRSGLQLALTIHNTGNAPFRCEEALHTYFAVGDIHQASVHGLERVPFTETATAPEGAWDGQQPLRFRAETDRVFHGSPDRLEVRAPALHRAITLQSTNARSAIVWNPWPAKTARLSQMAADDWQRFCCVESANCKQHAIEVAAGASHTLSLVIRARPV